MHGTELKIDKNANHGVTVKPEPGVKEIFASWAEEPRIPSSKPVQDKNHRLTNMMAIKNRATTAKQQGEFRNTQYANGLRFTKEQLMKEPKF